MLQIRKCQEVKEKLASAYATYRKSVEGLQAFSAGLSQSLSTPPSLNSPQRFGTVLGSAGRHSGAQRGVGFGGGQTVGFRNSQSYRGGRSGGASSSSFWSGVRSANANTELAERANEERMREMMLSNPASVVYEPQGTTSPVMKSPIQMRGQGGRGRGGRRRSSGSRGGRDVIEVSDSEEEEVDDEEALISFAERPKDVASERRSRDQRAADRAALRSAALSEAHRADTSRATSKVDPVCDVSDTNIVNDEVYNNTEPTCKVDPIYVISDTNISDEKPVDLVCIISDTSIAGDKLDDSIKPCKTEEHSAVSASSSKNDISDATVTEENVASCIIDDAVSCDTSCEEQKKEESVVEDEEEGQGDDDGNSSHS